MVDTIQFDQMPVITEACMNRMRCPRSLHSAECEEEEDVVVDAPCLTTELAVLPEFAQLEETGNGIIDQYELNC